MASREVRRRQMTRLLARRESEGLSLRELSECSGIPVGTLSWWAHRLRAESGPAFAELVVAECETPSLTPEVGGGSAADIVVRHANGLAIELRGAAAARVVDHVLRRIDLWS